jgi:hypothetical protein
MTVASEQCVIVGVISTRTVLMGECREVGGMMRISGRLTTAREPRERGCSGSEIVEMRSGGVSGLGNFWGDCERKMGRGMVSSERENSSRRV